MAGALTSTGTDKLGAAMPSPFSSPGLDLPRFRTVRSHRPYNKSIPHQIRGSRWASP